MSLDFSEEHATAIYDKIAECIEGVRTSLRIVFSDTVYARCMEELLSIRKGMFEGVRQSLENLHSLVNKWHSRPVLVENSRLD